MRGSLFKELRLCMCLAAACGVARVRAESATTRIAAASAGDPCVSIITFKIPSATADATSTALVIVPHAYLASAESDGVAGARSTRPAGPRRFPAIYLLHGHSGSYMTFFEQMTKAGRSMVALADRFNVILVMPDGKRSSWYLNAQPEVPDAADWQWETVITKYLVPEVDRRYRTWAEPQGRAITGSSMGGHGALYLAARHPELFSACSSISGVMNLSDITRPEDLARQLGPMEEHRDRWVEHSVLRQAERFAGRPVAVLIDCGRQDPFYPNNLALHEKLIKLDVPHDYFERPGKHVGTYWQNALPYHLQFLSDRLKPAGQAP